MGIFTPRWVDTNDLYLVYTLIYLLSYFLVIWLIWIKCLFNYLFRKREKNIFLSTFICYIMKIMQLWSSDRYDSLISYLHTVIFTSTYPGLIHEIATPGLTICRSSVNIETVKFATNRNSKKTFWTFSKRGNQSVLDSRPLFKTKM